MKKIICLLALLSSLTLYALELPVDVAEYAFKDNDTFNLAMGKSALALENPEGVITNPASIGLLKKNYVITSYDYFDYKKYFDSKAEVSNTISGLYFVTNKGGFFYRDIYQEREQSKTKDRKFNFGLKEFGLSIAQESTTTEGLFTGMNFKLYYGSVLDAKITNNTVDYLNTDRGLGGSFDFGLLYKKGPVAIGASWNDILGKVFWSKYESVTINGKIDASLGIDLGMLKYSAGVSKKLLDTEPFEFGTGAEVTVLSIPDQIGFWILKNGKAKVRAGLNSDNLFSENKKYSYGLELSNDTNFMSFAVVSNEPNPMDTMDSNLIKANIGFQIK